MHGVPASRSDCHHSAGLVWSALNPRYAHRESLPDLDLQYGIGIKAIRVPYCVHSLGIEIAYGWGPEICCGLPIHLGVGLKLLLVRAVASKLTLLSAVPPKAERIGKRV